jgi:GNAT superfamily N-acetyltransferase
MNILERNEEVWMVNERLADAPIIAFPARYRLRWYAPGDADIWLRIQRAADRHNTFEANTFAHEFGEDEDRLKQRVGFLLDPWRTPIGTISAWANEFNGREYGRIHWVAILPEEQGKGLGKPMMSAACQRLLELGHTSAYLDTGTARVPAINLYRQFGFEPVMRDDHEQEIWRELAPHLKAPLP